MRYLGFLCCVAAFSLAVAWVPASADENSSDAKRPSPRAEQEDTHLTVLAAWQDAVDAFPEELMRSIEALKTRIRQFISARLG